MQPLVTQNQAISDVRLPQDELLRAFAEFIRLDVAEGDASPDTILNYWSQARAYLDWCYTQDVHPALASTENVKSYRRALVSAGYARSTIAARLNTVRRFYSMAQSWGYRPDNPAEGVKAPRDRTDRAERVKWLPLTAVQRVLAAPDPNKPRGRRDRAILFLLALHGLRVVEVVRLDVAHFHPDAGRCATLTVLGKGNKRRTVLLVEPSRTTLRAWLAERPGLAVEGEAALFASLSHPDRGTRLSRRAVRAMVDGYLRSLGLKREGVSCHALRHSFATLSRAAGARLDAIARAMGHASVTTTQVYADIVDAAAENPARFLVGALGASEDLSRDGCTPDR